MTEDDVSALTKAEAELARTRIELDTAKTNCDYWKRLAVQKDEQLQAMRKTRSKPE